MNRSIPRFLTPQLALRLLVDVCIGSLETWALGMNWSRIGRKTCRGIIVLAVAYFVIRGCVSLLWGI